MRHLTPWALWRRPLAAALAGGVIAWFAFVANREVPVLDWFDLAVHEAGHLLATPLSPLAMFLAGSVAQIAFPLAMAGYFGFRRRDAAAAGFCLAWAGTSAWDVSVYAGDAVTRTLPLVGGGEHDWAYILGPNGFDALDMTKSVAGFIEFSGAVMTVLGIGIALRETAAALARPARGPAPLPSVPASPDGAEDPWGAAASLPFRHTGD
ncbi:MAG: hypothetical protein Q8Q29_09980 [Actinomycetota bacterium]|nr:hypothetical protein [Actinomycetota bacterium]